MLKIVKSERYSMVNMCVFSTQEELLRLVGVRRETIVFLEKNQYNPSLLLSYKISKVFGKPIEQIFNFEDEE